MKKSKGQTVDLLYTKKEENVKKTKSKNTSKKKNRKTKKTANNNNDIINLDNEIVIGLTPKKESTKNKKTEKKTNKKIKAKSQTTKKKTQKKTNKKANLKKKRKFGFIKWILLFILLVLAIVLFMMSSVFNIKNIEVINNNKISSEEIISLSSLTSGINMFKISNKTIRNNIKTNAYIENVKIKRNINGTVTLNVEERTATYMLEFANAYVYINNQGYMLEISETPLELPRIIGFSTPEEEIKAGNRLNIDDLKKLDDVNKIIEASKNSPLANIITKIDISKTNDYKLIVESEQKTIKIGDMNNLNVKLQMAGNIFEMEKEKKGEIYFQDNSKKAVFKEEV